MPADYALREAEDGEAGETFYALGRRYIKGVDGVVRPHNTRPVTVWRQDREIVQVPLLVPREAVGLRQFWDAAFPDGVTVNTEGVAGYIGGGTPNIWTDQAWADSMARSSAQFKLPIFVRVPPTTRDPVVEANFSADWAEAHGQPHGTLIALDYETSTVQSYLAAYDAQIVKRGYLCVVYGSLSTVKTLPAPSGGRWTAHWTNTAHVCPEATMTQYGGDNAGAAYDIDLALDSPIFWYPGGTDMAITPEDVNSIAVAVGKMFRLSPDAPMDIVQFGQSNNVRAFAILAQRLADLKSQVSALAQLVLQEGDQSQAKLDALKLEEDDTQIKLNQLAEILQSGGLSAQEVADLVVLSLGPAMAKEAADEVYRRMEA